MTFMFENLNDYRRAKPRQCPKCRYDLRGLDGGVCPECGESIESS